MNLLLLHCIFGFLIYTTVSDPVVCPEDDIQECTQTEFGEYMKCIEQKKEIREKRQALCPYAEAIQCGMPPCLQQAIIQPQPNVVQSQPQYIVQSQPDPSSGFRTYVVTGDNGERASKYEQSLPAGTNITTVINLHNMINNTNVVNVPTNINSTNLNYINIYHNQTSSESGGKFGLGYTEKGSCCYSVGPKSCRKSSMRQSHCHRHRKRTCGDKCTSKVIHSQVRRKHNQRRVVYVPQPPPPQYVYANSWPYTGYGGASYYSCEGCYDHYGYGYENYYGNVNPGHCNGCYNDGFEYGPLYRRGPVLRPFHYHEPPCEITGACRRAYYNEHNGYFGNDRIDPAFHEDEDYEFVSDEDQAEEVEGDVDDRDLDLPDENASGDWQIILTKCKVVDNDGTIKIQNCTDGNMYNPYAVPVYQVNGENTLEEFSDRRRSIPIHSLPMIQYPHYKHHHKKQHKPNKPKKEKFIEENYDFHEDDKEFNVVDY